MELKLYILLLIYFSLGAFAFVFINKRKSPEDRKNNWIKYSTYFVIINLLFFGIFFKIFPFIATVIILGGYFELFRLLFKKGNKEIGLISIAVFSLGFCSFFISSFLDQAYLLYLMFIVTVFDAFSQITGQYLGKMKLIPSISPNKTVEGLIGGLIFAGLTGIIIREILNLTFLQSISCAFGISMFAFLGDLFASFIKRSYRVKDFSKFIPGHGGFLDRFDSLIFSTLFLQLIIYCHSQ